MRARRIAKEHPVHGGANNSRGRNMIEADASAGGYTHTFTRVPLGSHIRVFPCARVGDALRRKREGITGPRRW